MKRKTVTIAPGDVLTVNIRGGGIAIPEHHGFRFYAMLGGLLNATSERVLTRLDVKPDSQGLGFELSIADAGYNEAQSIVSNEEAAR